MVFAVRVQLGFVEAAELEGGFDAAVHSHVHVAGNNVLLKQIFRYVRQVRQVRQMRLVRQQVRQVNK